MIIGILLRSIKIYKTQHYIPISDGRKFCSFVGPNGSGKSSILEALNSLFNSRDYKEWNVTVGASVSGASFPFLAAVLLIKKSEIPSSIKAPDKATLDCCSQVLWDCTEPGLGKSAELFLKDRDLLKSQFSPEDYYLIIVGRRYGENNSFYLSSFNNLTQKALLPIADKALDEAETEKQFQDKIRKPFEEILSSYKYFYIPVETDPVTYTKLETEEMQSLIGESIHNQIEKSIDSDALAAINTNLDAFIASIEKKLKDYKYQAKGWKEKLTKKDIVKKTIEVYFSAKTLHRKVDTKSIPVSGLSSGEKRRSLVDVAHAFLTQPAKPERTVILAIDEPDASLHISACFDQFEKLKEISNAGHQVLITTHWYGFMPAISDGIAHSMAVEDSGEPREVESFDLYSYPENIRHKQKKSHSELPKDVSLKAQNDLVQAIIASVIRPEPYNWIICEGLSDKIYLDAHLDALAKKIKLRVLPLAGRDSVRRLYEHLALPFKDKQLVAKGKIFCLIDTDANSLQDLASGKDGVIQFQRFLKSDINAPVMLVRANDPRWAPKTDIEDCLHKDTFAIALQAYVDKYEFLKLISQKANDSNGIYSSDIDLLTSERNSLRDNFFAVDDNKVQFARTYVQALADVQSVNASMAWLGNLEAFFSGKKQKNKAEGES